MATITLRGNEIHTNGNLPAAGADAPLFTLTGADLSPVIASDYKGKKVILNISPSLDTGVCAAAARKFNQMASEGLGATVILITKDLPFAQKRFCEAEGLDNVISASDYKNSNFADAYGTLIADGPMEGLHSRSLVIVDENGDVMYTEQVPETTDEPNYEAALEALKG
ncbi:MAG: thiol peroxidase [Bacteroidota bacterium]